MGESPEKALARELREELGIEATIGELRLANTHSYGEKGVILLFYDVPFWNGEPKPKHHSDLQWVAPDQIPELEIPEANRRILSTILDILHKYPK